MTTYDYPDDLLTAQQDLTQVRVNLTGLYGRLPYSVKPLDAGQRPEGYPDSPGWTEQEQQDVAALRQRERELAAVIVTHAFWGKVAGPERPDARSKLKHALAVASQRSATEG